MYLVINHVDETAYIVTLPFLAPAWGYIQSLKDLVEYAEAIHGNDVEAYQFSPEELYSDVTN